MSTRMSGTGDASRVRYHLRVTLTPEHWRQEERALWQVIRRGRIDEVMFFVPHAEERSTGLGTAAENAQMVRVLRPVFRRLRAAGVVPSINIWWTVSFSEFPRYPRDLRGRFRFRWAVSVDGRQSRSAACPRCPAWRAQVQSMYRAYASLRPERIWIDDDVRMTLRADMHCPCFCDDCLAEMACRTGRRMTRPALLKGILADPPNPVRNAWLSYQHELDLAIVREIAHAVHAVSPVTRVCHMHSGSEIHAAEGRRWKDLVDALGQPAPTFRPGIGPYVEVTGPAIAESFNGARLCQATLPPGTAIAPEIENYPHTGFFKSAAVVKADLVLAQLIGIPEMTFSIYRFGGRLDLELKRENPWAALLGDIKPKLQAIADLGIRPDQMRGVGLYWHEDGAQHARGVAGQSKPIFTYRVRPWDQALPLMGMATRYGLGGRVNAFNGEHIECLSADELRSVFSGGVLLDARAAESLIRMGKGAWAGLVRREKDAIGAIETIEDARFGGLPGDVMNNRYASRAYQFRRRPGARVISKVRGYRHEVKGHGVVLYENELGGRVVVVPFDSQEGQTMSLGVGFQCLESPSFICWPRQSQLTAALEWAGRCPLPLRVEGAPLAYPLLAEQADRCVVGVVNLMPDPVESLRFRVARPGFGVRRIRVLDEQGRWVPCRAKLRGGDGWGTDHCHGPASCVPRRGGAAAGAVRCRKTRPSGPVARVSLGPVPSCFRMDRIRLLLMPEGL